MSGWIAKTSGAVLVAVLASACVDPKVPSYTLTAPGPVATPTPTPPPPLPITPLTISLSVGPSSPRKRAPATFEARTTGLQGSGSYAWDFGDGTTLTTTDTIARHTYAERGMVTASVRVTEDSGRTADAAIQVAIRDEPAPPPEPPPPPPPPPPGPPTFDVVVTCTPGNHTTTVTGCNVTGSYGGSTLPSATITDVDWDWGDGGTDLNSTPAKNHQYLVAGTYTVFATVTATTVDGPRTSTATRIIVVP